MRVQARLARLVLRHLVRGVLLAPLAERLLRFRHLFAFARIGSVVVVSHHRLERDRSRALTRARPAPSHRARARRVARRAAASNASSASPSSRRTFTIFSTPRARQRGVTRRRARAICRARDGHLLNPSSSPISNDAARVTRRRDAAVRPIVPSDARRERRADDDDDDDDARARRRAFERAITRTKHGEAPQTATTARVVHTRV